MLNISDLSSYNLDKSPFNWFENNPIRITQITTFRRVFFVPNKLFPNRYSNRSGHIFNRVNGTAKAVPLFFAETSFADYTNPYTRLFAFVQLQEMFVPETFGL